MLSRLDPFGDLIFFTDAEQATALALTDQLLDQQGDRLVPVVAMIDTRLGRSQTDGWHYADLPEDAQAWRASLAHLDSDARRRDGQCFAECDRGEQAAIISAIQELGAASWHGLPAARVWSLWTRYACTAFYSHPLAWNEMGFNGPAYPRGYKNLGINSLEPFEVRDTQPANDPVRATQP
ncbi:MAG: gluconate 2-dehydrogenase subunit 3 family protein [Candidatus Nanopelagicales bacterium]